MNHEGKERRKENRENRKDIPVCLSIPISRMIRASTICCRQNVHIPLDPYFGLWDGFDV